MEMERDVTIEAFNYCIGAKPIQQISEKYKEQFENVLSRFLVLYVGSLC